MTRPRPRSRALAAAVFAVAGLTPGASGQGPASVRVDKPLPAIRVRLAHPDAQLRELIALFRGSKAEHPAAALAAWKRASAEPKRLGKPLEAVIAAFNPTMIPELRTLDDAQVAFRFEPGSPRTAWRAFLPHDDGTFSALASAFVLTDGEAESPFGEIPVDRLGPPGSPLMARGPATLLIAPDRDGLSLAQLDSLGSSAPPVPGGISLLIENGAMRGLSDSTSLAARRIGKAFGGLQAPPVFKASTSLKDSTLTASVHVVFDRAVAPRATVEPSWLDATPVERASASFALAIEPGAAGWDSAFALLDRVEQADPTHAGVAPSRIRVGLAARAAGVRIEDDVIPHLKGISGWVALPDAGLLTLHMDDPAAASRVAERARPPEAIRKLPGFSLGRDGPSVVISWGANAAEDSRRARSAAVRGPAAPASAFVASFWPGRIAGLAPADSPLQAALDEAAPMTWTGRWTEPDEFRIEGSWPGLNEIVRRFLDRIPLDPPPDR